MQDPATDFCHFAASFIPRYTVAMLHPDRQNHRFLNATRTRSLAAACLVGASLMGGMGCSNNDKSPLDKVMEPFFPATPGEVARDVWNVYDADKRRRAIDLLSAAKFGGEEAYVKAYRLLIDDQDATVRASCAKALGNHGTVDDALLLIRRMTDESAPVRWECAKGLQKIRNPAAIGPLMEVTIKDEDPDVRMAAAFALGQYAEIPVFQTLLAALDDREFGVRYTAAESLSTLTGEDFGADGGPWLEWSKKNQGRMFAGQKKYTWLPFVKPRGFWAKTKFWKDAPVAVPQEARTGAPTTQSDPGAQH